MPKRRTSVERVINDGRKLVARVVVFESQKIEGEMQEIPIGEQQLTFALTTTEDEMLPRIKAAARDIEALADKAKDTRAKLNKLLEKGSGEG